MKLLIVDDHPLVRAGLRRLIATEPELQISEVASGPEAISAYRDERHDLVLLDLNLPGMGGLEVLARLLAENSRARIVVISMYDNPLYIARVLEAGARGYVSKNAPPEQILEAIRRVGSGRTYVEPEMAQELALGNVHAASNPLSQLSARDVEILRLLADGSSLTEIADSIGVSYKTVANQCSQLKAKLATPRMADLIRVAISCGFGRTDPELAVPSAAQEGRRT
jgi:two-component system, NarL family, invasion response regulator UvrY